MLNPSSGKKEGTYEICTGGGEGTTPVTTRLVQNTAEPLEGDRPVLKKKTVQAHASTNISTCHTHNAAVVPGIRGIIYRYTFCAVPGIIRNHELL